MRFLDKEQLRRELPLEFACAKLGIHLNTEGKALCPFHADTRPSFKLWRGDDGLERWHCWPCGSGGDLFDLIMRIEGLSFTEAVNRAEEIWDELPTGYTPVVHEATAPKQLDVAEYQEGRSRATAPDFDGWMAAAARFTRNRDPQADAYLRNEWGWGVDPIGNILVPHWDAAGNLTGVKVRSRSGTAKWAYEGSRFVTLYGAWRPKRGPIGLLTEGETDAIWAARRAAREGLTLNVYSLPRGANAEVDVEQLKVLQGLRHIFLALDPDEAGIKATRRWIDALTAAGWEDVRVCRLPLGRDLREVKPNLTQLLNTAVKPMRVPEILAMSDIGIFRQLERGVREIASWTIEPQAALVPADGETDLLPGFEVQIRNGVTITEDTITMDDLSSVSKMRKWAAARGLAYQGNDSDTTLLTEWLVAKSSILPEVFQTNRAGVQRPPNRYAYARRTLVTPATYIGDLPWRYVPGLGAADVSEHVLIPSEDMLMWDWRWLDAVSKLSQPRVVHPILAWSVAATRRNELRNFPMLFIGGSSGAGKTTLAQLIQRMFGSDVNAHLGQSTPFILMKALASTTTLPVFIDEWTRNSRQDTLAAFQGIIPILYEGGTAQRGTAEQQSVQYRMTAPVMIAGEDTFALDRELERMVVVKPTRRGQNHEALHYVAGQPIENFSRMFYRWLLSQEELPALDRGAPDRTGYNRDVLIGGWETLHAFLDTAAAFGEEVPILPRELDLSDFEQTEDDRENVYELAVHEALDLLSPQGTRLVWPDPNGQGTWVRFAQLVNQIGRSTDISLPGGRDAMRDYFRQKFEVEQHKVMPPLGTSYVRAHLIRGFHVIDDTTQAVH